MNPAGPGNALGQATVAAYTTVREDIAALVPAQSRRLLDVGCSNGELGAALQQRAPGRVVLGIERDEGFAAMASQRLHRVVATDLDSFRWEDAFGADRFDCVIFADVLEHLADPDRHLAAARAHLVPGGHIVVSLPNVRHVSALWSIYVGGHFPKRDRGLFDRTHRHWFTLADGRAMLERTGFDVLQETQALRLGDKGGGRANRLLNRLPGWVRHLGPVRQFLTYQVSYLARVRA